MNTYLSFLTQIFIQSLLIIAR
ncbi:hypothetical protein F383_22901 [Gossypium arboreum]|uniref:Uncharacterized protein n=1 Tax=Gossypium arboreum TaxID=29729 RepID=A0A0B0P4A2_GOSAR|nr:hypothetical protein F383_22901 [Gossypium arboreum]